MNESINMQPLHLWVMVLLFFYLFIYLFIYFFAIKHLDERMVILKQCIKWRLNDNDGWCWVCLRYSSNNSDYAVLKMIYEL